MPATKRQRGDGIPKQPRSGGGEGAAAVASFMWWARPIGSWFGVINTMSIMAVITNAFLLSFSSSWLYDKMLQGVPLLNVVVRRRTRGPCPSRLVAGTRLGALSAHPLTGPHARPHTHTMASPALADEPRAVAADHGIPSRGRAGV